MKLLRIQYLFILIFLYSTAYGKNDKETRMEKATFGGGCFWCMEHPFEALPGVKSVISGYAGGTVANPTYEQVKSGQTGHAESIQVTYDPAKIPYSELLNIYWRNINPTQKNGQFNDHGSQYRTVIFYHNEKQKKEAESSKKQLEESKIFKAPIVTEITSFINFYPAEEYHQNFYKKNSIKYGFYRKLSGRDDFIKKTWGNTAQCSKTSSTEKENAPAICTSPTQKSD
ncbi:MAG: peptide-methionine (S)-S-oxide reductase MsrA [Bdellovibrionales bacterium]|nr:peptide-methionine (S)-S-oxide reductase MsrA [Bdellovibrionales bacterium]